MNPREEQVPDKDEPATPKSSRLEDARQIIEEYAEGLRQIIKKLRRRLNAELSGETALLCGGVRCHQIFSINYGEVGHVDRATHRANLGRRANPIQTPT